MLKSTKVEIKKEHQVLMIDKTTSFKKRAKGKKGNFKRTASKLLLKWRSLSLVLSLRLSACTAKGLVTGSGTTPTIWWIRRMAKWTRVYLICRLLMCALLVFIVSPWVFDTCSVAKISNSKQELHNKQRLVEGKWRWVLEVVPRLIWSSSHTPYTFRISVKPK